MVTPSAIAMLMTSSTAPQGRGERGEEGEIGMEGQGERRGGGGGKRESRNPDGRDSPLLRWGAAVPLTAPDTHQET